MFVFYLKSIIIWMIILECTFLLCKDPLKKRFPTAKVTKHNLITKLRASLTVAAIPIVRLIVVIMIFYITFCKQEDLDKMINKANKE